MNTAKLEGELSDLATWDPALEQAREDMLNARNVLGRMNQEVWPRLHDVEVEVRKRIYDMLREFLSVEVRTEFHNLFGVKPNKARRLFVEIRIRMGDEPLYAFMGSFQTVSWEEVKEKVRLIREEARRLISQED